ncbi:MAG TPA: DUF6677 family protein [Edaphobacter sp.]|nr:DUF6677 family protein [Edaphobacter sp.]
MTTNVQAQARPAQKTTTLPPVVILIAGWLIPGAGHFLLKKWIRGTLLFVSILAMFGIGIALKGKVYGPNTAELLDMLNFAGDLGNGLLYVAARVFDLGQAAEQVAIADYGTKFIVVAGLLNIIAAVDAHSLAIGRKAS